MKEIHWKVLARIKLDELLVDIVNHSIDWHSSNKCNCMREFRGIITKENFIPCEHLEVEQWKKFQRRIQKIDKNFKDFWTLKILNTYLKT